MAQAPRPIGVIFKSVLPSCRVCIFLPFLGFTKSWQPQGYPYYDYDRRYRSVSGSPYYGENMGECRGGEAPSAGVWGVPSSFPSFAFTTAGGLNQGPE